MKDKPTLYQPRQRRPFEIVPASELLGWICYRVPTPAPEDPQCPEGEWYCENPDCVVREVTVACKLSGESLPTMKCPACEEPLTFHHWLKEESLEPYKRAE